MAPVRYTGIPSHELERLRPTVDRLRELRNRCKPLGEGYQAVSRVIAAYQALAAQCTGKAYFFGGNPNQSHGS
jgi:hypothetical protein